MTPKEEPARKIPVEIRTKHSLGTNCMHALWRSEVEVRTTRKATVSGTGQCEWASRTFSEEGAPEPLEGKRERGFHAWRAARTEAWICVQHVTIHGTAKPTGWSQGLGDEAAEGGENRSLHPGGEN